MQCGPVICGWVYRVTPAALVLGWGRVPLGKGSVGARGGVCTGGGISLGQEWNMHREGFCPWRGMDCALANDSVWLRGAGHARLKLCTGTRGGARQGFSWLALIAWT